MSISSNPKRLLCIVGGMNAGGAETFLMKIYRELDKKRYQMDFYVNSRDEGFYEKEIISMGGRIYRSTPKSEGFMKALITLKKFVKKEKYRYVLRVSQHSLSAFDLMAAKLGGAQTLIYRSSNSKTGGGIIREILHNIFKSFSIIVPNVKLAPSTEAADFMFGKKSVKRGKVVLIKNAIKVEEFIFTKERRDKIREELKINDKFVVGHVGRFNNQKNHNFLIDIFNEIIKKNKNSILILVGKGELENDIKNKIKNLNLSNNVIFTGVRSNIADLMMGMDAFVFPSFFEGMPNTVIEAQATGLHCIISNNITKEANVTGNVEYLSLKESAEIWASKVINYPNKNERNSPQKLLVKSGYSIEVAVQDFVSVVFESNK